MVCGEMGLDACHHRRVVKHEPDHGGLVIAMPLLPAQGKLVDGGGHRRAPLADGKYQLTSRLDSRSAPWCSVRDGAVSNPRRSCVDGNATERVVAERDKQSARPARPSTPPSDRVMDAGMREAWTGARKAACAALRAREAPPGMPYTYSEDSGSNGNPFSVASHSFEHEEYPGGSRGAKEINDACDALARQSRDQPPRDVDGWQTPRSKTRLSGSDSSSSSSNNNNSCDGGYPRPSLSERIQSSPPSPVGSAARGEKAAASAREDCNRRRRSSSRELSPEGKEDEESEREDVPEEAEEHKVDRASSTSPDRGTKEEYSSPPLVTTGDGDGRSGTPRNAPAKCDQHDGDIKPGKRSTPTSPCSRRGTQWLTLHVSIPVLSTSISDDTRVPCATAKSPVAQRNLVGADTSGEETASGSACAPEAAGTSCTTRSAGSDAPEEGLGREAMAQARMHEAADPQDGEGYAACGFERYPVASPTATRESDRVQGKHKALDPNVKASSIPVSPQYTRARNPSKTKGGEDCQSETGSLDWSLVTGKASAAGKGYSTEPPSKEDERHAAVQAKIESTGMDETGQDYASLGPPGNGEPSTASALRLFPMPSSGDDPTAGTGEDERSLVPGSPVIEGVHTDATQDAREGQATVVFQGGEEAQQGCGSAAFGSAVERAAAAVAALPEAAEAAAATTEIIHANGAGDDESANEALVDVICSPSGSTEYVLKKGPPRRGKWSPLEEDYARRIIRDFDEGLLNVEPGTGLRQLLASKLRCEGMRISKKFCGVAAVGKRAFRPAVDPGCRAEMAGSTQAQASLYALEQRWLKTFTRCRALDATPAGGNAHLTRPSSPGSPYSKPDRLPTLSPPSGPADREDDARDSPRVSNCTGSPRAGGDFADRDRLTADEFQAGAPSQEGIYSERAGDQRDDEMSKRAPEGREVSHGSPRSWEDSNTDAPSYAGYVEKPDVRHGASAHAPLKDQACSLYSDHDGEARDWMGGPVSRLTSEMGATRPHPERGDVRREVRPYFGAGEYGGERDEVHETDEERDHRDRGGHDAIESSNGFEWSEPAPHHPMARSRYGCPKGALRGAEFSEDGPRAGSPAISRPDRETEETDREGDEPPEPLYPIFSRHCSYEDVETDESLTVETGWKRDAVGKKSETSDPMYVSELGSPGGRERRTDRQSRAFAFLPRCKSHESGIGSDGSVVDWEERVKPPATFDSRGHYAHDSHAVGRVMQSGRDRRLPRPPSARSGKRPSLPTHLRVENSSAHFFPVFPCAASEGAAYERPKTESYASPRSMMDPSGGEASDCFGRSNEVTLRAKRHVHWGDNVEGGWQPTSKRPCRVEPRDAPCDGVRSPRSRDSSSSSENSSARWTADLVPSGADQKWTRDVYCPLTVG